MEVEEFVETAGQGYEHVIERILFILLEFEVQRRQDEGNVVNGNIESNNFLGVDSDALNVVGAHLDVDILVIGWDEVYVLYFIFERGYEEGYLKGVLFFCANVAELKLVSFHEETFGFHEAFLKFAVGFGGEEVVVDAGVDDSGFGWFC